MGKRVRRRDKSVGSSNLQPEEVAENVLALEEQIDVTTNREAFWVTQIGRSTDFYKLSMVFPIRVTL
jgi:hypothetical protein